MLIKMFHNDYNRSKWICHQVSQYSLLIRNQIPKQWWSNWFWRVNFLKFVEKIRNIFKICWWRFRLSFDVFKNLFKLIGYWTPSSSHCLQFSRFLIYAIWSDQRNSDDQISHWRMWYNWDLTLECQYQKYIYIYIDSINCLFVRIYVFTE